MVGDLWLVGWFKIIDLALIVPESVYEAIEKVHLIRGRLKQLIVAKSPMSL